MSTGPVDCHGVTIGEGDVCRIIAADPDNQKYVGTPVTITEVRPPGCLVSGFIGPLLVMAPHPEWTFVAESESLPATPVQGMGPWVFEGGSLQKLFGPSVDLDEDTDKEKEKDDALPA